MGLANCTSYEFACPQIRDRKPPSRHISLAVNKNIHLYETHSFAYLWIYTLVPYYVFQVTKNINSKKLIFIRQSIVEADGDQIRPAEGRRFSHVGSTVMAHESQPTYVHTHTHNTIRDVVCARVRQTEGNTEAPNPLNLRSLFHVI